MAAHRWGHVVAMAAACLVLVASPVAAPGAAASQDVEAWVAGELANYVSGQLTTAPAFADATVHLVIFAGDQPAPRTDALSLALRDTLRRHLAGRAGIRLGWQPEPAAPVARLPLTAEQCEALEPGVLIGIELRGLGDRATASVRALDDDGRGWVPGFGREWQGRLTSAQQRAHRTPAIDRTYLGGRDVPYAAAETDLIANHLARDLRCQLMRRVTGEYRLAVADPPADDDAFASLPALVRRQIGGLSSLSLVPEGGQPNAEFGGQLHPVAGGLHQYWLVIEPVAAAEGLQPLASSVYVALPPHVAAGSESPGERQGRSQPPIPAPTADVLSDLELVRLSGDRACHRPRAGDSFYGASTGPCAALRITARTDAVVFILNHQQKLGLVRLGDDQCAPRPRAHVLREGESVTVRVPGVIAVDDAEWSTLPAWSPAPGADVYYALASADSEAAHALAKLVAALPARCSESLRPGLDGTALEHWLRGLGAELERRARDVEWRAVQTRSIL